MLSCRLALPLLIAVGDLSHGGETNYYASLLASVNGSPPRIQQVADPTLVDTNNTANKVQGCLFRLNSVDTGGPIGNIQLGMSMDEVVRVWGKPPQAWWNYQGGPRFDYESIILYFAANKLSGICINAPALREVEFEPTVAPKSPLTKWQQTLKGSTSNHTKNAMQLLHATNQFLLTLSFRHGKGAPLFQLRLEQCATDVAPLRRGLNRVGVFYVTPRDKYETIVFAKLGAQDQGFRLDEFKEPDPVHVMQVDRSSKSYWLVHFEYQRPIPDSGLFAHVDQKTGEVDVSAE